MKLAIFTTILLFFTSCFTLNTPRSFSLTLDIKGNSFCSGGSLYKWGIKGKYCGCEPALGCAAALGRYYEVLYAFTSSEAGEKCYRYFKNNEVCRQKCIDTFTVDCFGIVSRKLYIDTNTTSSELCKNSIGVSPDCI